ncbi:hypothetical protein R1sor_015341 [Riccia sorocarpa]|uniref:Transposase-associated domain-containing protein n=1 Tax=Riccia sorocarpa TaxID=122646 RepID=A0ABD3HEP3_9MARC
MKLLRRELDQAISGKQTRMRCPCNHCKCCRHVALRNVSKHLYQNGRFYLTRVWRNRDSDDWDSSDSKWVEWGDGGYVEGTGPKGDCENNTPEREQQEEHIAKHEELRHEPAIYMDEGIDVHGMIAEAFQAINSLRATVDERDQPEEIDYHEVDPLFETRMDLNVAEEAQVDIEPDSSEVEALKEACAPLFNDARISKLSFVIILLNIFATHGCPNIALDELLSFLQQNVLPTPNLCPQSQSQAKGIRMYKCREIADLLTWSARHKSSDG